MINLVQNLFTFKSYFALIFFCITFSINSEEKNRNINNPSQKFELIQKKSTDFKNSSFTIHKTKKNILSKQKKIQFRSIDFKSVSKKQINYNEKVIIPKLDTLNLKTKVYKAQAEKLNKLYQNFLGMSFDSYTLHPSILYKINSNRNKKKSYFFDLDFEIPYKLYFPNNLESSLGFEYFYKKMNKISINSIVKRNKFYTKIDTKKNKYLSQILTNFDSDIILKGDSFENYNYLFNIKYGYFQTEKDRSKYLGFIREQCFGFGIFGKYHLNKIFNYSLNLNYDLIKPNSNLSKIPDENKKFKTRNLIKFTPSIGIYKSIFDLSLGFNLCYSDDKKSENNLILGPKILCDISISKYLIPYVHCGSGIEANSYKKILEKNPFYSITNFDTITHNTFPINLDGGLKIFLPYKILLILGHNLKIYNELDFFVYKHKKYSLIFDKCFLNVPHFDISYTDLNENFYTNLGFKYYIYSGLKVLKVPEHKPKYVISWYNAYNLFDKLFLIINFKWLGGIVSNHKKLKDIFDLDFGMDYRFTKRLYASLTFTNIIYSKKERYEGLSCNDFGVKLTGGFLW